MKMRVLLTAAAASLAATAYAAPLNYFEDFESYENGATSVPGWTYDGVNAPNLTIRVTSDTTNKVGDKSLAMVDSESILGTNLAARYEFDGQTKVIASLDLWVGSIPDSTATEFSVMLRAGTTELARLNISQSATNVREIKATFGTTPAQVIGNFDLDTQIPISITADAETDTWSVSVGGDVFSGNFRNNNTADAIDNLFLRFQGANNSSKMGSYYIDNVSLVPEPAMLGLVGLSGLLTLRRRSA